MPWIENQDEPFTHQMVVCSKYYFWQNVAKKILSEFALMQSKVVVDRYKLLIFFIKEFYIEKRD